MTTASHSQLPGCIVRSPRCLRGLCGSGSTSPRSVSTRRSRGRLAMASASRVQSHQYLTSLRMLKQDPGYRSFSTLGADLAVLTAAGVITCQPIGRAKNRSASAPESEALPRSRNWSAGYTVATLITVHGVRELRDRGAPEIGAKREETSGTSSRRRREVQELEAFERQMASEGR
jgi:hypothetical protein